MLLYGKTTVLAAIISLTVTVFCMTTQVVAEEQQAADDALIKAIADVEQSHAEAVDKTTLVEAGDAGDAKVELTPQQIDEIGTETAAVAGAASSVEEVVEEAATTTGDAVIEAAASVEAEAASVVVPAEVASGAIDVAAEAEQATTEAVALAVPTEAAETAVSAAVETAPAETVTITPTESVSAEVITSVEIAKQDNAFLTFEVDRRHACAIKTDNTLWCWGANNFGQLGNGNMEDSVIPAQVGREAGWRFIKRGEDHTCGIKMDASLWCWGANHVGQLGDGTTTPSSTPINVGGTDWIAVDGHGNATCGTKKNGALSCWGVGVELSTTEQVAPVVDDSDNCGVNKDGSVWCWQISQM